MAAGMKHNATLAILARRHCDVSYVMLRVGTYGTNKGPSRLDSKARR
jgi:hypothetical protein